MIKIEGVSFSYNRQDDALTDVTLEIKKGSWTSILGHNGSGKSTLMKNILGLLTPSEGEVIINGQNTNETDLIRKKL